MKQKVLFYFTLITLCFNSLWSFSQEVMKAPRPKYPDVLYTKEIRPTPTLYPFSWEELNTPVYTYDTISIKHAQDKINYFKKYFSSPPIQLKECIYISPSSYPQFDLIKSTINKDERKKTELPPAFLFYSDTIKSSDKDPLSDYKMHLKFKKPIEEFYQPFYFRKTEVTNKEYREFVTWVRDSIARRALAEDGRTEFYLNPNDKANSFLNYKEKITWDSLQTKEVLEFMYLPVEERFYHRKEFDSRKILFRYTIDSVTSEIIYIYPDTLGWVNNFRYVFIEPLTNMYFWHPAFDDYPVTGISQLQAKAFLIWKTKQEQEKLDRQNSNYTISYELPNEIEWEMVATKDANTIYSTKYQHFIDNGFETNLLLTEDTCASVYKTFVKDSSERGTTNYLITFPADGQTKSFLNFTDYIDIGTKLNLFKANLKYKKKPDNFPKIKSTYQDENDVLFMAGNISEWMKETYEDNWKAVYLLHQNKLKKINSPYSKHLLESECLNDEKNDKNGVLVRGSNWYDLSLNTMGSKNFEGMNKKRFVDPKKAYPTIGFRYVVKVYRKDESELIKKEENEHTIQTQNTNTNSF